MSSVITVLKLLIKEKKTGVLDKVNRKRDNIEITSVHQLMSVLPKDSLNLIPEEFRKIYLKELKILNPEKFEISYEGTSKKHEGLEILPLINIRHVDTALKEKDFKLPKNLKEKEDIIIDNKK
jgi:5'-3' exonuclease